MQKRVIGSGNRSFDLRIHWKFYELRRPLGYEANFFLFCSRFLNCYRALILSNSESLQKVTPEYLLPPLFEDFRLPCGAVLLPQKVGPLLGILKKFFFACFYKKMSQKICC